MIDLGTRPWKWRSQTIQSDFQYSDYGRTDWSLGRDWRPVSYYILHEFMERSLIDSCLKLCICILQGELYRRMSGVLLTSPYSQMVSQQLFFARDPLGRRSLLIHEPTPENPRFLLASVSAGSDTRYEFTEVPTDKIYCLDLRRLRNAKNVCFALLISFLGSNWRIDDNRISRLLNSFTAGSRNRGTTLCLWFLPFLSSILLTSYRPNLAESTHRYRLMSHLRFDHWIAYPIVIPKL